MNEQLKQAYNYTASNTTQVVVAVVLVFLGVYYVTELLWPVAAVAVLGGLLLAYGAGVQQIEDMDDIELQ